MFWAIRFLVLLSVTRVAGLRILQLTDFHYDVDYSVKGVPGGSQMCHVNATVAGKLGLYGDYECDSPIALIKHALTNAAQIIPDPELILWTGDNVPHISGYDTAYTLNAINTTTELIKKFYPKQLILPVFGNHDYSPANSFPDNTSTVYSESFKFWSNYIGDDQKDTFLKAGYYLYRPKNMGNITFLMLNTNLYYTANKATFTDTLDPGSQFAFMESTLKEAEKENRLVHIIAHIAPGVFERTPNFFWMSKQYNKRFLDITVKYAKTIKWMLFGHHHTDTFHIVKDSSGNPVQLMLMAPAVTPWFSNLTGAGSNNPAFRVIEYDDKTWDFTDIKTYYIDLARLNANKMTSWQLEYSMTEDYGIEAINATSMNNLLQTMKTNDSVFFKYIRFNSVQWEPHLPNGQLRLAQLCSMEYPDLDQYITCMNNAASSVNTIFLTFVLGTTAAFLRFF